MRYILDSFTFCTQIAGTDIAYNLKITYTALEGPALYGSSATLTSSVHRATMLVLMMNNKVTVSKCMMPVPTENQSINITIILTIFHHLNFANSKAGHCPK